MNPDFSRDAGRVLLSPYFLTPPPTLSGTDLTDWWDQRDDDKAYLEAAIESATDYNSLKGRAKTIFDAAGDAIASGSAYADVNDRINEGG